MPAAAVIPAPIAYIKVVAVKKLVVGSGDKYGWFAFGCDRLCVPTLSWMPLVFLTECLGCPA